MFNSEFHGQINAIRSLATKNDMPTETSVINVWSIPGQFNSETLSLAVAALLRVLHPAQIRN